MSTSYIAASMTAWMLWLLAISSLLQTSMVSAQQDRALLYDTTVYCNVTSGCKPCQSQHLDSEACRPTAYAEHFACSTSPNIEHQTTLTIHRRVAPRTSLLHISRSCKAPAETEEGSEGGAVSAADSINSSAAKASDELDSSKDAPTSITTSVTATVSHDADNSTLVTTKAVYLYPLSGVGGLNLLYFELAMLIVLSGALPVVYMRKRRFARL